MDERDANHPPFDEDAVGRRPTRTTWAARAAEDARRPDPVGAGQGGAGAAAGPELHDEPDGAPRRRRRRGAPRGGGGARPARRWWGGRRLRLAVAAAAAAAFALGVVLVDLPGETTVTGPAPSIAAARARMDEAMASIKTLQGDLVITDAARSQAERGARSSSWTLGRRRVRAGAVASPSTRRRDAREASF